VTITATSTIDTITPTGYPAYANSNRVKTEIDEKSRNDTK